MDSYEDVQHVASLARLTITEEEARNYFTDFESILSYIDQIEGIDVSDVEKKGHRSINTMRDDVVTVERGEHTDNLVGAAPESKDGYIAVQKVL